jgi:hypothetical protein
MREHADRRQQSRAASVKKRSSTRMLTHGGSAGAVTVRERVGTTKLTGTRGLDYSYRKAMVGSTVAARRAGSNPASSDTSIIVTAANTSVSESVGATP